MSFGCNHGHIKLQKGHEDVKNDIEQGYEMDQLDWVVDMNGLSCGYECVKPIKGFIFS